eukprot:TRINITY_DN7137_c0_g1_i2.p1 TRINITY_DN7137_c0_g1~~TRINITY_DN7137_c0_g1_i2.p1  ORF type:complete len:734 (+),score=58.21 TRINITY_DN7137_c0_g1_i2:7-2208(+)
MTVCYLWCVIILGQLWLGGAIVCNWTGPNSGLVSDFQNLDCKNKPNYTDTLVISFFNTSTCDPPESCTIVIDLDLTLSVIIFDYIGILKIVNCTVSLVGGDITSYRSRIIIENATINVYMPPSSIYIFGEAEFINSTISVPILKCPDCRLYGSNTIDELTTESQLTVNGTVLFGSIYARNINGSPIAQIRANTFLWYPGTINYVYLTIVNQMMMASYQDKYYIMNSLIENKIDSNISLTAQNYPLQLELTNITNYGLINITGHIIGTNLEVIQNKGTLDISGKLENFILNNTGGKVKGTVMVQNCTINPFGDWTESYINVSRSEVTISENASFGAGLLDVSNFYLSNANLTIGGEVNFYYALNFTSISGQHNYLFITDNLTIQKVTLISVIMELSNESSTTIIYSDYPILNNSAIINYGNIRVYSDVAFYFINESSIINRGIMSIEEEASNYTFFGDDVHSGFFLNEGFLDVHSYFKIQIDFYSCSSGIINFFYPNGSITFSERSNGISIDGAGECLLYNSPSRCDGGFFPLYGAPPPSSETFAPTESPTDTPTDTSSITMSPTSAPTSASSNSPSDTNIPPNTNPPVSTDTYDGVQIIINYTPSIVANITYIVNNVSKILHISSSSIISTEDKPNGVNRSLTMFIALPKENPATTSTVTTATISGVSNLSQFVSYIYSKQSSLNNFFSSTFGEGNFGVSIVESPARIVSSSFILCCNSYIFVLLCLLLLFFY